MMTSISVTLDYGSIMPILIGNVIGPKVDFYLGTPSDTQWDIKKTGRLGPGPLLQLDSSF